MLNEGKLVFIINMKHDYFFFFAIWLLSVIPHNLPFGLQKNSI